MTGHWPQTVLILYEGDDQGGDFGRSFADGFRANGCNVTLLNRSQPWDRPFDLALAYGPFRLATSMLPPVRRLLARPAGQRPLFAWWLTEGVPTPQLPGWLTEGASRLRLAIDRSPLMRPHRPSLARGHRLRVYGELRWVQSHGALDVLAVTSASCAAYLRQRGFAPIVVPLGHHPHYYGEDLGLARDVDVCFIGNVDARRRRGVLQRVCDELCTRGVTVSIRDAIYGTDRTRFLNRCRIMLNILRAPQDFVGQRFLLAAANKALIVSEPLNDLQPFEPGRHLVVAPIARIAETVAHYLSQEAERRRLVDQAYHLITHDLTIAQMTGRILAQARRCVSARADSAIPAERREAGLPSSPGHDRDPHDGGFA